MFVYERPITLAAFSFDRLLDLCALARDGCQEGAAGSGLIDLDATYAKLVADHLDNGEKAHQRTDAVGLYRDEPAALSAFVWRPNLADKGGGERNHAGPLLQDKLPNNLIAVAPSHPQPTRIPAQASTPGNGLATSSESPEAHRKASVKG